MSQPIRRRLLAAPLLAGLLAAPAPPARASAPYLTGAPIVAPCWVSNPRVGPSGYREILIGNLRARLWGGTGGLPGAYANAFYNDDFGFSCGWSDWSNMGITFPPATDFVLRLDSAIAIDDHPTSGGTVEYKITVEGRSGSCDGAVTNTGTLMRTLAFGTSPVHEWIDADVYDTTSPSRLAFRVRSAPFAGAERYFRYSLRVTATTPAGAVTSGEEGCFKVTTF